MKNAIIILSLLSVATTFAAEFHVAPAGVDTNPGTAAKPFATLEKARDAVRAAKVGGASPLRNNGTGDGASTMEGDTIIIIHGGTYVLAKPFVLTPQDSGKPGKPVRYIAAKGETPVFTSARAITGWKVADAATPGLAECAKGKVFVADVPKGWRFHFLHADGRPQPVARMTKQENWHHWPKVPQAGTLGPKGQAIHLPKEVLTGLPANGDLEINFLPVMYWNSISVLREINAETGTCIRHSKNPTSFRRSGFRFGNYNLLNALKFLTQPGEWCVDSAAGKVYYWPNGAVPAKIWAPSLYRLLETQGTDSARVHDIELRGLTFTCTDRLPEDQWPDEWVKRQAELPDAMVYLEGVENWVLEDNIFSRSGAYGIALEKYAQNVRIIRNEIAWPGCGGVQLQGYGPGTTDVNKNNVIRRNYIHHTGNGGYLHSAAVTLYQSNGNDISLNWITNMPYAAVQIAGAAWNEFGTGKPAGAWDAYGNLEAMYKIRWNEIPGGKTAKFSRADFKRFLHSGNNRICDNIVADYMERLGDGGALYCWGCGNGNLWQGNLLRRDKPRPGEELCIALYMDDHVDGATLRNNLCWHVGDRRYKTLNKGANKWENNIIQSAKPAGYDSRLTEIMAQSAKEGGWLKQPAEAPKATAQAEKKTGSNPLPNNFQPLAVKWREAKAVNMTPKQMIYTSNVRDIRTMTVAQLPVQPVPRYSQGLNHTLTLIKEKMTIETHASSKPQ